MSVFDDGYYAGLVNDRENPHPAFTPSWLMWRLGNDVGVSVHCATVEAVYLNTVPAVPGIEEELV
jgi:hypothetical protein